MKTKDILYQLLDQYHEELRQYYTADSRKTPQAPAKPLPKPKSERLNVLEAIMECQYILDYEKGKAL